MIKELGELNEKFYELYGRLYENGELLTPKQAALMADNLLAQYKAEYELLALKTGIEEAKELYSVRQRRGALIPHRWRFLFWRKENYAAQTIDKEIQAEITRYFNERERALARLVDAIEKENEAHDARRRGNAGRNGKAGRGNGHTLTANSLCAGQCGNARKASGRA